jgi:hypothetical protein
MSTLVSRVLSHSDKLSIINNASSWLHHSSKKEEAMLDSSRRSSIEDYTYPSSEIYNNNNNNPQSFTPTASPRYSMAPPPYENVLKETTIENKRFGNALSTIWKRASFSSSGNTANDIKMTPPQTTTQIDKKQMEHAITLINVATDMNNSGNQQMAIDLYMMGLDKLISALPCK